MAGFDPPPDGPPRPREAHLGHPRGGPQGGSQGVQKGVIWGSYGVVRGVIWGRSPGGGPKWGHFWALSLSEASPEASRVKSRISGLVKLVQIATRGFGGFRDLGGPQNTPNRPKMDISVCRFWDGRSENRTN